MQRGGMTGGGFHVVQSLRRDELRHPATGQRAEHLRRMRSDAWDEKTDSTAVSQPGLGYSGRPACLSESRQAVWDDI